MWKGTTTGSRRRCRPARWRTRSTSPVLEGAGRGRSDWPLLCASPDGLFLLHCTGSCQVRREQRAPRAAAGQTTPTVRGILLRVHKPIRISSRMLHESYRTRGAVFAFLVGPPRDLTRQNGMEIHARVCDALGVDDIDFKYRRQPVGTPMQGQRPFSIELDHQKGPDHLNVNISGSAQGGEPLRLVFLYDWPASIQLVLDDFDLACNAVFSALGSGLQTVLAEARVRGQFHAPGNSSLAFLGSNVINLPGSTDGAGGELSFLGFKYETPAADFTDDDLLANPKREVSVEVLREDPRCLYVEVMSQWPQVTVASDGAAEIGPGKIRSFRSPPSDYLSNTNQYLESVVFPLLVRTGSE